MKPEHSGLNDRERAILTHCLCGGKTPPEPYRNYYMDGPGSPDFEVLERLVERGLMYRRANKLDEVNQSYVYHATTEGVRQLGLTVDWLGTQGAL